MTYSFVDVDPTAIALGWLRARPRIVEAFTETGVTGLRETPWPHLRVFPGASGSIGNLAEVPGTFEVSFEVYGNPDGSTGSAALRRLAVIVLEEMLALGGAPYEPGTPYVVHEVTGGVDPFDQPLSNGQQRWGLSVNITTRPHPVDA